MHYTQRGFVLHNGLQRIRNDLHHLRVNCQRGDFVVNTPKAQKMLYLLLLYLQGFVKINEFVCLNILDRYVQALFSGAERNNVFPLFFLRVADRHALLVYEDYVAKLLVRTLHS